ncbi:putative Serum response factor [Hypsibius exemplaris]|uniref:Serum response factor homolog n=1 Tax=Hypsibius exemplaris TaxID=2072580 RepID=A0A1W0XF29_HYPEX|nr:putative Serum response factor [Hypsibius exemplaris]
MTSPSGHSATNGTAFNAQTHLTLASTSTLHTSPAGPPSRTQVSGLERLGMPEKFQSINQSSDGLHGPSQQGSASVAAPPPQPGKLKAHPHGKKTKGRVKIKMEFIDNKLRRYTTFSKRKAGLMKKAYELSTLTGTEVMLLVASETGHVYTFATRKLQPMIASEDGKKLIQTCLNSNLPNGCGGGGDPNGMDEPMEHRMNLGTGYDEEADGDDDEEYFDDDGDSSNGSPPPPAGSTNSSNNARFHNPAPSSSASLQQQQLVDSQPQFSQADYLNAAGVDYGMSPYSAVSGQDVLLNGYEVDTRNYASDGGGGIQDASRR